VVQPEKWVRFRPAAAFTNGGFEMFSLQGVPHLVGPIETPSLVSWLELEILHVAQSRAGVCRAYRFLPPKPGMAVACFIHDAAWRSSRSSTDLRSTPLESLPIPTGVTGGTGLSAVPRPNVSLT
jgi:hypothetical protein